MTEGIWYIRGVGAGHNRRAAHMHVKHGRYPCLQGLDGCWVERLQLRGPCAASGRSEDDVRLLAAAIAQPPPPPPPRRQSDMSMIFTLVLLQYAIYVHRYVHSFLLIALVLYCAARHAPFFVYSNSTTD